MAKMRIPGVGASEGMREMNFVPFPPGDYLLKVKDIDSKDKEGTDGKVVGVTFEVTSEVLGGENLPSNEDIRDWVGKDYKDFIFVMTPDHPSYANTTKVGGIVGEIGLASLKSFLTASGVKIVKDEFDEKKAVGSWIEVTVGTNKYKDKNGNDRVGNQVYSYRPHEDETASAESAPDDVTFEDDLIE